MNCRRAAIWITLTVYLLFLLDLTWLQFPSRNPPTNVVPLRSIIADWRKGGRDFVVNFLGNIVAFVPIGMIPRLARPRRASAWHAALLSFSLSLLIEGVQYATGRRVADVDDLILNTSGGVLGHCTLSLFVSWGRGPKDLEGVRPAREELSANGPRSERESKR
jgi:glycopeptide antibiotics resistance protein